MGLESRENKRRKSIVEDIVGTGQPEVDQEKTNPEDPKAETIKANLSFIEAPKKEEARSKQVNFLIQPSVYTKVQAKSKRMGLSVNEIVNQFFVQFIDE